MILHEDLIRLKLLEYRKANPGDAKKIKTTETLHRSLKVNKRNDCIYRKY